MSSFSYIFELLQPFGVEKKYSTKEILFHSGQEAEGFYYILSGEIRLYKLDENAKELEIQRFGANNFIGEVILFAAESYPATAEIISNAIVYFFPKNIILKAIDEHPEIARNLLILFAKKCYSLNQFIYITNFKTIRMKLIDYLLSLCSQDGKCLLTLPIKKIEIAKQLGTISATLSRNFNKLEAEGLIKVSGKQIQILNCKKLKEY